MRALLRRCLDGAVAGFGATAAMTLVLWGCRRLGVLGEPPPRRITRRLLAPLAPVTLAGPPLDAATTLAHFGFGMSMGSLFGLPPTARRSLAGGALFGSAVWALSYGVILPRLGLMPRPQRDRVGRPSSMLLAHLVYGSVLAGLYRELATDTKELRGKVVIVAGGSRGLGRALARELAQHGAKVAICGRAAPSLERTRAWLEQQNLPVLTAVCDLRSQDQTNRFVERVERELGPVDVLIANAATIEVAPLETLSSDDFEDTMHEIFGSALHATFAVLPGMRQRGRGKLALVTSIGGKLGVPHLGPYTAAKFAQVGFAEVLRAELHKNGIEVLTIVPGLMRTGSHLHASFRGAVEREFSWFGASALTPLVAMDADRAARRIVRALVRGDRHLTFTGAAILGRALHDLFPGGWAALTALAARLLPAAPRHPELTTAMTGESIVSQSPSRFIDFIRRRGLHVAERHGQ